jgi:hypothetical protein
LLPAGAFAEWDLHHWKAPASHGAQVKRHLDHDGGRSRLGERERASVRMLAFQVSQIARLHPNAAFCPQMDAAKVARSLC